MSDQDLATQGGELSPVREALRLKLAQDMLGSNDAMETIATELMNAETVEDVLDAGGTLSAEEIFDVPIRIERFELRKSADEYSGSEAFAVIYAVALESNDVVTRGELIVVTCGGYNVIAALLRIGQLNGFPVECAFKAAGKAIRLYRPRTTTFEV